MVNSNKLQINYIELYKSMRKYIWDLDAVEALAAVEVETYKSFPNIDTLRSLLDRLRMHINATMSDDDELKETFDDFYDALNDNSSNDLYSNLKSFKEVQQL